MSFIVKYGDITKCTAEAVVIPANPEARVGGPNSVDYKVYEIAGKDKLLEERKRIGNIEIGKAEITPAFDFPAKYIIHAVSPAYEGGDKGEEELLRSSYRNALLKAKENECYNVVFPVLSTGLLNYPMEEALKVATEECTAFCNENPDFHVSLIKYSEKYNKAKSAADGIEKYIRENTYYDFDIEMYRMAIQKWSRLPEELEERRQYEVMRKQYNRRKKDEKLCRKLAEKLKPKRRNNDLGVSQFLCVKDFSKFSLEDYLSEPSDMPRFIDLFCKYQRERDAGTDADICKKINIPQSKLTKMKSEDRPAARNILWRLALVFKLNMKETEEFFNSCVQSTGGIYRLSKDEQRRERAYKYFILNEIYNINEVDQILYEHGLAEPDEKTA